jgi:ankyrin repeat protein
MILKVLKNPETKGKEDFSKMINDCSNLQKNKEDFSQEIFEIICMGKKDFTNLRGLVKKGVNLNSKDPLIEEFVPIIAAAQHNKIELLEELIDLGADVNKTNKKGLNCLMILTYNLIEEKMNDVDKIIEIIDKVIDKIDINHKDKQGRSILTYAIGSDKGKLIDKLLELNVEITDVDYVFASAKYISSVMEKYEENQ